LLKAKWKLPKTRQATDRLLISPQEHDFWQADHIFAVAEGGGSTGLDNLRTLCTPCHSAETEQLLARLKTLPHLSSVHAKDSQTQMDIISAFSNKANQKLADSKERRKRRRVAD
jgi:5-methylcytosine-specific restriction endonuclease McrA